ncbi:MAG: lactate/malate family dehydrogenase, partial [Bacillota bacterium]
FVKRKEYMNYYKIDGKICFSLDNFDYKKISKKEFIDTKKDIFFLKQGKKNINRDSTLISDPGEIFVKKESIKNIDLKNLNNKKVSNFILKKINDEKVFSLNTNYKNHFINFEKDKYKVNVLGLGDVGSNLTIGLKLLGSEIIKEIGLYDRNDNKLKRFEKEFNQIAYPNLDKLPEVKILNKENLFDCDVFVFTASKRIARVGDDASNVRMEQYSANSKIIKEYAKMAREANFKGLFAVVSDPVDLLCNDVYYYSNMNELSKIDRKGLLPNQVKGYGLGVMNARANYFSKKSDMNYYKNGRVYGPHGKGLIVADDINNYDIPKSIELTKKTINANLEIRDIGYKPYIAPAFSSGAISIIETLKSNFQYSTVFINGIYYGLKNKIKKGSVLIEKNKLDEKLFQRINNSYNNLKESYEKNKNFKI